jgi:hypothetical protein
MTTDQLYILLDRYSRQTASVNEEQELMQALTDPANAEEVKKWMDVRWDDQVLQEHRTAKQSDQLYLSIQNAIRPKAKVVYMPWKRIAAAAIVILLLSVGGYFYFNQTQTLRYAQSDKGVKNDVAAPNVTKAMITLANGQTVALDSITNGILATQGI